MSAVGNAQRHPGGGVGDDAADLLGGALARPEDVVDAAGFEFGHGGGADHAAVSDDTDAGD